ncbi:T9SS C-terminal target domain-containing protein [Paludibacter sp. 221]|uniref:T9SS-dependent choice-of-anchor J family protein n=1 Tax=Paludibacter sp. 221 TaxID=2302939 RepID=UPI0013D4D30C|nr:T9SS type A sorting domain-containing protein [Paludibacter sp. 221]NDV45591.1 T9SS C-terminal target domain-containing protein [Paludibacter sp. 221]
MKKCIYLLIFFLLTVSGVKVVAQGTATLPYFENFDTYAEGTVLPDGWLADSKSNVKMGAWNDAYCVPYTKPYYLQFSDNNATYPRNDWAFSVGFNLQAGKTYYTSFWLYAAGFSNGNLSDKIKFTVGTSQTKEGQTVVLEDIKGTRFLEWTQFECKFTAETSGIYYFAFNVYTDNGMSNGICIDNFEVYAEDNPPAVQADYITTGGIWSAASDPSSTNNVKNYFRYVYPDQPITFINRSKYASSYSWETLGNPASSTEENPTVYYTESGYYEPVLTATNFNGSATYKDTVNVCVLGSEEISGIISNQEKIDGKSLYRPEDLMNNGYEYVSGFNRYYKAFAEKFDMPEGAKLSVNAVSLMLYEYKVASKDRTKPVTVKIYGDAEGVPDPDKVFGSYQTTMSKAFGTTSVISEKRDCKITFDTPVEVEGTFYVAIEIDESLKESSATYMGFICFYKANRDTKAFAYIPETDEPPTPELKVGEGWYPLHELPYPFYDLEGLSFYLAPSVTFHKFGYESSDKSVEAANFNIYPTVFNEEFTIESENVGGEISVFDISGKKVYETILNSHITTINTSDWNSGIYIVNMNGDSQSKPVKIIKL